MKKIIIFAVIILIVLLALYKMDIKPEAKEIRKEINNDKLPSN